MPRGKKREDQAAAEAPVGKYAPRELGEVEWGGFINCNLSPDQKTDFGEWVVSEDVGVWSLLEDAVTQGLKYGLTWDEQNQCYIATLTGNGCLTINKRFCLTSRAGTYGEATALLMFKHVVLAQGDWGTYRPRTRGFDNWG